MTRAFAKSDRIGQVERLLLTSRVPLSQAEIARRCEVHRSTIGRLVQGMIDNGIPVRLTDDGLIYIERTAYLSQIHLRLHEALAVFLACRLLARYSDKPNEHTVATLEKLGTSLQSLMPVLGQHISGTTTILRNRLPKQPGDYQRTLEKLTEAWATGVKLRMWYRPLQAQRAFQHTFAPYMLEPSAIGYSTYAIGLAEPPGKLRTRKVERIERIELTDEPFTIPPDFDPNALLAGAWGIWFDLDDQPTTVRLRFSGNQTIRRVLEAVWHPSQHTEVDNEAKLNWTAEIDEPQEMMGWIRGWGPACEVIEPTPLREQIIGEVRRQMRMYGIEHTTSPDDELVAHTPAHGSTAWHTLSGHLKRVAELTREFAEPFGAGTLGYYLGLWHDIGKSRPAFQAYLRQCYANPTRKQRGPDHKAAGATFATRHMDALALLIQGHHGGLNTLVECRTWLKERQTKDLEPDGKTSSVEEAIRRVQVLLPEIEPTKPLEGPSFVKDSRGSEFFLRMLFSALVDADYLDTEAHMNQQRAKLRGSSVTMADLLARFMVNQKHLEANRQTTFVNTARDAMYQACVAAAELPPGLFRLAIPTGGGKTRSGMVFGLQHAVHHGLRRIIVAVPFISITEQTAEEYRAIFEHEDDSEPLVLEHHSGVTGRDDHEYSPEARWQRLAAENWDAPVVVTTTVQLFESMFAHQTGRCRKLHRLARSVIILDEAQALPAGMLAPILDGLKELCTNYGSTVVLSTATQPAFEHIKAFADLRAHEIIPDAVQWFRALKRVEYEWHIEQPLAWADIAKMLHAHPQALVVVNTKKDALALLEAMEDPTAIHLSTLLCGAHRRDVIAQVKARLQNGLPCRLISTQVIEAGVDLDFPLVFRAFGPLDRVIQAAGRCNREGLLERGRVVVFEPVDGGIPSGAYRTATDVTRTLVGGVGVDLDAPDDLRRYFRELFASIDLDSKQIQVLREQLNYPEVAKRFHLIDEAIEHVVVTTYPPDNDVIHQYVQDALTLLREEPAQARTAIRRLQPYLVSIPLREAQQHRKSGLIEELPLEGIGIWHGQYDHIRGLVPDDERSLMIF
ncbi:CRISPR-associated endonuclease Cas3'' [Candidatus Chloroploca asiatica]|nr:CRISPR-associated endonuclease Cas3'' [Candidatus Chloroploca asiatica]